MEQSQLVCIYFGDQADDSELLGKVDLNDQVTALNVVAIRATKPQEQAAPPASLIPVDRLRSKDLWAAYGVTESDTFVITDRHGNPYYTGKETALNEKVTEVASHFRSLRKTLRKQVEAAETAREAGKTADAVSAIKEGLKLGLTGYDEADTAIKLYNELIESGRKQLKEAGDDAAKLDALAAAFAGTDLEKEIKAARKAKS
jgi:hypothetical protein